MLKIQNLVCSLMFQVMKDCMEVEIHLRCTQVCSGKTHTSHLILFLIASAYSTVLVLYL